MSEYLVEIAFGPVQGFIAAARRSRDLWAGSYLLSEVARAAGQALLNNNATLIYPLATRVGQQNSDQNSNLSNVLLARVSAESGKEVAQLIGEVQQAARDWLKSTADASYREWGKAKVVLRKDIWDRQVADALETFGAWAEIPPTEIGQKSGYRIAYENLKATFAARKNTRNFEPMFEFSNRGVGNGIPKSSLDGLRESVLPKERSQFPPRFGLSAGEQLDALGCIKRVEGRKERFVALTRLAAHDWLKKLEASELTRLINVYEPLVEHELATRAKAEQFDSFPYDAGLLYEERLEQELSNYPKQNNSHETVQNDHECSNNNEPINSLLMALKKELAGLQKTYGKPCPYAVMVVADGDRMGMFVDKAQEANQHTSISDAVASFADKVPTIASAHGGISIFNGGEDLTVMFPLSGLLGGARALSDGFRDSMKNVVNKLLKGDEDARPTLRVGAAICHVLEPLGTIRRWGDEAEKVAKGSPGSDQQGNALGLVLHVRAGHEIQLRLSFENAASFTALSSWIDAYRNNQLPGRLGYDARSIAQSCQLNRYETAVAETEFLRLLRRARESGGDKEISDELVVQLQSRREELAKSDPNKPSSGLLPLADELILGRWLSATDAHDLMFQKGGNS